MFGEDVYRLRVRLSELPSPQPNMTASSSIVFQRDGNYGDNWNLGQVTLNLTTETMVSTREAQYSFNFDTFIIFYNKLFLTELLPTLPVFTERPPLCQNDFLSDKMTPGATSCLSGCLRGAEARRYEE